MGLGQDTELPRPVLMDPLGTQRPTCNMVLARIWVKKIKQRGSGDFSPIPLCALDSSFHLHLLLLPPLPTAAPSSGEREASEKYS
ncbi:hypothetical protein Lal_00012200 [Lupinus albus]|nr:hypothetical protein Lal_00012200 [Lupinus albus]